MLLGTSTLDLFWYLLNFFFFLTSVLVTKPVFFLFYYSLCIYGVQITL